MSAPIELKNLSFPAVLDDLEAFVKTRADYAKWKDFYAAGVGQTYLELLAGLGSYLSAHSLLTRRESYHTTAKLRSSLINLAAHFGYPVNRKSAPVLTLNLAFGASTVLWDKANPIGEWRGNPLVLTETQELGPGNIAVPVYVGDWRQVSSPGGVGAWDRFVIDDPDVDNNPDRMTITSGGAFPFPAVNVVPFRYPEQLKTYVDNLSATCLVITSPGGATLIFGDNTIGYNNSEGAPLTVDYVGAYGLLPFNDGPTSTITIGTNTVIVSSNTLVIEKHGLLTGNAVRLSPGKQSIVPAPLLAGRAYYVIKVNDDTIKLAETLTDANSNTPIDISATGHGQLSITQLETLTLADITLNVVEATLVAAAVTNRGSNEDSNQKIAALIPGYWSARRAMLSEEDHIAMLLSFSGSLIGASAKKKPGVCCTVQMGYLFENEHEASPSEKQDMLEYLLPFKHAGETIEIVDPTRIGLTMTLVVVATADAIANDLAGDIEAVVRSHLRKLGTTFYVGEVTKEIGALDGVLAVYLQSPASDKELDVNEYLSLDALNLTLTSNRSVQFLDPDNEGYTEPIVPPVSPSELIPDAPTNLSITDFDHDSVQLVWSGNSDNEDGFIVERRLGTETDDLFTEITRTVEDVATYTDATGLLPDTVYAYRVRAFNAEGESTNTNVVTVRTAAAPLIPFAPTSLAGIASPGMVTLTWSDNSDDEAGFSIERKLQSEPDSEFDEKHVTAPNVESWIDDTVVPSTAYSYRVKAQGVDEDSSWSNTLNITSSVAVLQPPSALYTGSVTPTSIQVVWIPPGGTFTKYELQRKDTVQGDDTYVTIAEPANNLAIYTDSAVAANTSYTYRIRTVNGTLTSDWSETEMIVTPPAIPFVPENVSLEWVPGETTKLEMRWDPTDLETHKVYFRETNTPAYEFSALSPTAAGVHFQQITGLTANTSYDSKVSAINGTGESAASAIQTKTTPTSLLTPPPDTLVIVQGTNPDEANLTWNLDSGLTETAVIVEFTWAALNGRYYRAATLAANSVAYTLDNLAPNIEYTIRVYAINATQITAAVSGTYTTPA